MQFAPAIAQDPRAEKTEGARSSEGFHFTSEPAETSRAGYVSIEWSEYPGAFSYRLVDNEGTLHYQGAFTKAFVSGLPNGEYAFRASALDEAGQVLSETAESYPLTVEHWSLTQALSLFGIGLAVFLCLVAVIVRGVLGAGSAALQAESASSDRSQERTK